MKIILYLVSYIIYPFSFLFPRNSHKYAFGSFRGAFNDNAKYLFIYAQQYCPEMNSAWISNNRATVRQVREHGFKAYYWMSPRGIWHALTSKYWFYNSYTSDINHCLSGRAICINLWHGIGLKRIEYNIITGPLAKLYDKSDRYQVFTHPQVFRAPNYIVTSNPFQTHMFSTAFRVPPEHCLELGYPRNAILKQDESTRRDYIARFEPAATMDLIERMYSYSKVHLYMPTWRDSQRHIFTQSMDLDRLNAVMASHNELLLLKPHSNVIVEENMRNYSNILFLDGKMDVYPIMPYTHVLITDYSSVLYDYLLMPGKDVILYIYDYKEYLQDRDLFYPFEENVAGVRIHTFDELVQCLDNHQYTLDEADRQAVVDKLWGESQHYDSCQKLLDMVQE